MLGSNKISTIIDRLAKMYKIRESKMVACIVGKYHKKECIEINAFSSMKYMQFENLSVRVPNGYDTYLRNIYGDYMKLPPIEKRKVHPVCKIKL